MWLCWLFYFLLKKLTDRSYFFKSASLHFSHAWKICILEKQATEVILIGWFGKCQSIKKVGGRHFVKGLYQALFSFRLARRNVFSKRNENRAWSQVRCGRKSEIVRYFQGRLCDKIGLLCDFFRANLHCFTRFQRRKTTLMLFNRQFECKGIIKHLFHFKAK